MTRLDGHVAVVTGGNRGIGLGLAEGLVAAGATVAVWARDRARSAAACEQLDGHAAEAGAGGRGVAYACDVADEDQVEAAMAATLADHGKVDSRVRQRRRRRRGTVRGHDVSPSGGGS